MKNLIRFRFTFFAAALLVLGSCSKATYTFAPNTGTYHGTEKTGKAIAATDTEITDATATADASVETARPVEIGTTQTEASTALAAALAGKVQHEQKVTATDKKAAKATLKQLTKDLKQFSKKDVKDGQQVQMDQTVKLFLVLGLVFLLLGILVPILWKIGIILLIIALVFLVLNTL